MPIPFRDRLTTPGRIVDLKSDMSLSSTIGYTAELLRQHLSRG